MFRPVVVIPTFNHGETVVGVVEAVISCGHAAIVVDDGSTDGTDAALAAWGDERGGASVLRCRHPKNRGKAAALRTGFRLARDAGYTHVVSMDADGQLDPRDIGGLLERSAASPQALVIGVRPLQMEGCPERCAAGRRYASLAVRAQTGVRLSDTQCGLRCYPLDLVERLRCRAGRYSFEAEVITRALWSGAEVIEAPVWCTYRTGSRRVSHFRPWRDSLLQAGVHMRLLGRALVVGSGRAERAEGHDGGGAGVPRWRRLCSWLNPLRCWRDIRQTDLGTLEASSAVAIGALIGTLPFFGLHTLMGVYVAWRFHLHPAMVVLGTQVSTPPFGVGLAVASIIVGRSMLTLVGVTPEWPALSWSTLPEVTWTIGLAWLVGSLVVGSVVCGVTFVILRRVLPRGGAAPACMEPPGGPA